MNASESQTDFALSFDTSLAVQWQSEKPFTDSTRDKKYTVAIKYNVIVDSRFRSRVGADPGKSVCVYTAVTNPCCPLLNNFEYRPTRFVASPTPGHHVQIQRT